VWVALHGLGAIEPEIRAEIIAGVAQRPLEAGLIEFLRLLVYAHDPVTRAAALDALASQSGDDPRMVEVWATIASDHPDHEVSERARRWLGGEADTDIKAFAGPDRIVPHIARTLVTALDAHGRCYIVLEAKHRDQWTAAAFQCDVSHGVVDVIGQAGPDRGAADELFTKFGACPEHDAVEGEAEMALDLLAASLSICDPRTTPALRYWIERTVGPSRLPQCRLSLRESAYFRGTGGDTPH